MGDLFDDNEKQVILGNPPSKSNRYIIINFKSKATGKQHSSLAKTKATRDYEKSFVLQCNKYRNANITGPFSIDMDVYFPTRRSDLDNCIKSVLDCLQSVGAYANDNECVRILANKFLDKDRPRIEFTLKQI